MKTSHIIAITTLLVCFAVTPEMYADGRKFADDYRSSREEYRDSLLKNRKVIFLGKETPGSDSIENHAETIQRFYYDQFHHFQQPDAPYFLFLSRDDKLAMGMGGCVRLRAYYDWDGACNSSAFAPIMFPVHPDPTNMRHFGTTPAGTTLYFKVMGNNKVMGNFSLYIEGNFNGYKSVGFKLKKAYAEINDWTIGYANSTYSDPAALPPSVDSQGPSNKISNTSVLVRWMPRVGKNWLFAVSAESPSTAVDTDDVYTKKVSDWCPDGAAFIQYEWGRTSHVRLAGIVRALNYRDLVTERNHKLCGYGLLLSCVAHPLYQVTVYGSVNYGKGNGGLGTDLLFGKYDMLNDPEVHGLMYMPRSYGFCLGVQYDFNTKWLASASFSKTCLLTGRPTDPDEYRYGLSGKVNAFWTSVPRLQLGAEFDFGRRVNYSGESRWAKRVGAVIQFSF
ncbi:MAG: hypothetical protein ACI30O_04630 [Muribaculaceae bacterium]